MQMKLEGPSFESVRTIDRTRVGPLPHSPYTQLNCCSSLIFSHLRLFVCSNLPGDSSLQEKLRVTNISTTCAVAIFRVNEETSSGDGIYSMSLVAGVIGPFCRVVICSSRRIRLRFIDPSIVRSVSFDVVNHSLVGCR